MKKPDNQHTRPYNIPLLSSFAFVWFDCIHIQSVRFRHPQLAYFLAFLAAADIGIDAIDGLVFNKIWKRLVAFKCLKVYKRRAI